MDARIINPFISSTLNVLKTMAMVNPSVGKPFIKKNNASIGVVTGIIGLASEKLKGTMVVSFDKNSIVTIVNNMLGESHTEVDDEIIDAVGELTNMICGGVKKELSSLGMNFSMATPVMLVGKGAEIKQLTKTPIVAIPFEMPEGKFVIEANIGEV